MANQTKSECGWESASVQQALPRDIGVVLDRSGVIHTVPIETPAEHKVRDEVPLIDEENRETCLNCTRQNCTGQCELLVGKRSGRKKKVSPEKSGQTAAQKKEDVPAKTRVYVGRGAGALSALPAAEREPASTAEVEIVRVADVGACMAYLRRAYAADFRDLTDAGLFNCVLLLELALSRMEEEEEAFLRLLTECEPEKPEEWVEKLSRIHPEDTARLSGMLGALTAKAKESAKDILASFADFVPSASAKAEKDECPVHRCYRELMEMIRRLSGVLLCRLKINLTRGPKLAQMADAVAHASGVSAEIRNRAAKELDNFRLEDGNRLVNLFCQMMDKDGEVMTLYATTVKGTGEEKHPVRRFEEL